MIGLTGAHRTGKTTLARLYASRTGIPFVETNAKGTFERLGFDPRVEYSIALRLMIQAEILADFDQLYIAAGSKFITDRTPIDTLAYTMADISRTSLDSHTEELLNAYTNACIECCNRHFTTLVVVKPGIEIKDAPGKAPPSRGYIEHLTMLVLGLTVDPRVLAYNFYITRGMTDIEARLRAVQYAVNQSAERHKLRMAQEIERGERPVLMS